MKAKNFFLLPFILFAVVNAQAEQSISTTTYTLNISPTTPVTTETTASQVQSHKKRTLKELVKKYCTSIITGSIIGGTTGYLEKFVEKHFDIYTSSYIKLLSMLIECVVRENILNTVLKDFEEYDIKINNSLTKISSSGFSWAAYLV